MVTLDDLSTAKENAISIPPPPPPQGFLSITPKHPEILKRNFLTLTLNL